MISALDTTRLQCLPLLKLFQSPCLCNFAYPQPHTCKIALNFSLFLTAPSTLDPFLSLALTLFACPGWSIVTQFIPGFPSRSIPPVISLALLWTISFDLKIKSSLVKRIRRHSNKTPLNKITFDHTKKGHTETINSGKYLYWGSAWQLVRLNSHVKPVLVLSSVNSCWGWGEGTFNKNALKYFTEDLSKAWTIYCREVNKLCSSKPWWSGARAEPAALPPQEGCDAISSHRRRQKQRQTMPAQEFLPPLPPKVEKHDKNQHGVCIYFQSQREPADASRDSFSIWKLLEKSSCRDHSGNGQWGGKRRQLHTLIQGRQLVRQESKTRRFGTVWP